MVQSEYQIIDNRKTEVFVFSISGKITAPRDDYDTDVQILIADITDGDGDNAKPVLCSDENFQMEDSPAFCLQVHNGKIPRKVSILPNWVKVASVPCNILEFPGGGQRKLVFAASLLSHEHGNEFLSTSLIMHYENTADGYVDVMENLGKPIALSIQIASEVAATAENESEAKDIIKDWIILKCQTQKPQTEIQLNPDDMTRFLDVTLERIGRGEHLDIQQLCKEMLNSSTILDRYELVKLCLNVTTANSYVKKDHTDQIIRISSMLNLAPEKISSMAQKTLTIDKHKIDDILFLLGVNDQMSPEQVRQHINKEYQKWNGRVTHPDQEIRLLADNMLSIIAEAKSRVMGQPANA